jgi:hypothetical protein
LMKIWIVRPETKQRTRGVGTPFRHPPSHLFHLRGGTAPRPFSSAVDLHRSEDGGDHRPSLRCPMQVGCRPSFPLSSRPAALASPCPPLSLLSVSFLSVSPLTILVFLCVCLDWKGGSPSLKLPRLTLGRVASSTVVLAWSSCRL